MLLVLSAFPVSLTHEWMTEGRIDWFELGGGRIHPPKWLSATIIMPVTIYFLIRTICPWFAYLFRGQVFAIENDGIRVGGQFIENEDLTGITRQNAKTYLHTAGGKIAVDTRWTDGGDDALNQLFGARLII